MIKRRPRRAATVALAAFVFAAGFGCKDSGPKNYRVSGNVTYDNKPVKRGFITFEPDFDKGNSGPGGGCEIHDGAYSTPPGKGIVGGPYKVKIIAFDGIATTESGEDLVDGKPLFPPFHTTLEFAKQETTSNFDVPRTVVP